MKISTTLLHKIKKSAVKYPDGKALVLGEDSLTYKALLDVADKWAISLLNDLEVNRLNKIVVFLPKTINAYIGILSTLLAGAAFIPINPHFPKIKNMLIIEQCQPDVIITDEECVFEIENILKELNFNIPIFIANYKLKKFKVFNKIFTKANNKKQVTKLPKPSGDDIAYILYTSGSTGIPKGVPIKHKNIYSFISYNQKRYKITSDDNLSQTFDLTFDLSMFDMFMAWCHGATVCSMQSINLVSPAKYIDEHRITVWFSVPSIISLIKKQKYFDKIIFPSIRLSLFCGEALLEEDLSYWAKRTPNAICENLYGPTELTVSCSAYRWKRKSKNIIHNKIVSIGKLYPHMDYILIDENLLPIKNGNVGELCINGKQRFEGYLYLPDENLKKFIYIKNTAGKEKKYYRTGDLVKIHESGNILYIGRLDQQIKVNGYRIELGEIESALCSIEGVERAVAIDVLDSTKEQKIIIAYIIGDINPLSIYDLAKQKLPFYMLPKQINIEKMLPLTLNGKIDRKYLASRFIHNNRL